MNLDRNLDTFLTDVDDTVIPWETAHAKAYPAMSQALSEASGLSHQKIIDEIRMVNTRRGTIEYTSLVQEMPSFAEVSQEQKDRLVRVAIESRRQAINGLNLPYRDIDQLLKAIKEKGIREIAFSDAPKNLAYLRLKRAGFTKDLLDAIIALESPPDSHFDQQYHMEDKPFDIPILVSKIKKPNTDLVPVLQKTAEQIFRTCFMMGNSAYSDMGVAKTYGMLFYLTEWDEGTPEDRRIIKEYAPETVIRANVGGAEDLERPVHPGFECVKVQHPMQILKDLHDRGLI